MAPITVHVKLSNAGNFAVEVELTGTVLELKQKLVEPSSIPTEQQRLIYKGRVLKDDVTLASCGVEHNQNLYLVRGTAPAARAPAPAATQPTPGLNAASHGVPGTPGTGTLPGADEMGGLGGLGGLGGIGPCYGIQDQNDPKDSPPVRSENWNRSLLI